MFDKIVAHLVAFLIVGLLSLGMLVGFNVIGDGATNPATFTEVMVSIAAAGSICSFMKVLD